MALRWVIVVVAALMACGPAIAVPKAAKKDVPAACKSSGTDGKSTAKSKKSASKDDDDDDADGDDEGVRFGLAGGCAKLTGGVSYTYQQSKTTASGCRCSSTGTARSRRAAFRIPCRPISGWKRRGKPISASSRRQRRRWSKATGDGTQNGTLAVTGWSVGLGGLTVGYTGTLMSFWEGDFLTTANSPVRAANTVVYEREIVDNHTISVGLESNLPTTPQTLTGLKNIDFSDPVYTLRYRYEFDDATFHLSGLARRADFSNSPLLPLFPNTAAVRTGWAASAGVRLPVKFIGEDDEFSVQATYASDASSYLGISTDLVVYQRTVRSVGPTTGWSAVASICSGSRSTK